MTHDATLPPRTRPFGSLRAPRWAWPLLAVVLLAIAVWSAWQMEARFAGLERDELRVGDTPVTLLTLNGAAPDALAVVAHGFGGSRQMMDQIAVTLARSGFAVASFDFAGHGRNPTPLSPDITRIEGTTAQLVAETLAVTEVLQARTGATQIVYAGHSMATDVVIRAAAARGDVAAVAAISMYSEAITPTHPSNLLVVSGAFEGHLREAGIGAVSQIAPNAGEGVTVGDGIVQRRAVAAPGVGHVGVLYSQTTLDEVATWLTDAVGLTDAQRPDLTGPASGALLAALALLAWPLARLLPRRKAKARALPWRHWALATLLPAPALMAAAVLMPSGVGAVAGFTTLSAAFAAWGAVQMAVLVRFGYDFPRPDVIAVAVYLAWGLGIFALALDRYGAAFLPAGAARLGVVAWMCLGTIPLMLGDAMAMARAPLWQRIATRIVLVFALGTAMALNPMGLGLTFTVLPVLVLFFLVYGSLARWIGTRRGDGSAALGAGLALAWAVAASTPLFAPGL